MQNIGFMGFAKFGGQAIDRAVSDGRMSLDDFKVYLEPLTTVSLARDDYKGIAGAGGAAIIADKLSEACKDIAVLGAQVKAKLLGAGPSLKEQLDKAEQKTDP